MINKLIIPLVITLHLVSPIKPASSTNLREPLLIVEPVKNEVKKNFKTSFKKLALENFALTKGLNTNISSNLIKVLESYKGPKALITSLKRNKHNKSKHNIGNAVDLNFDAEFIDYLIQNREWLEENNLNLYIEGKPNSKRIKAYLNNPTTAPYVFFNPEASGDHIHINIK